MRDLLKDGEVKQRRHPMNDVENDRAEKLREDDLPVAHRCGHERFDRAELKLLRKKPHGNERKNQNEGEPEENRIKKCFLHRVLHRALVHVADLEIEIDAAHEQEKDEHDVSDRRVEVTAHFAHEQGEEFTHGCGAVEWWSDGVVEWWSILPGPRRFGRSNLRPRVFARASRSTVEGDFRLRNAVDRIRAIGCREAVRFDLIRLPVSSSQPSIQGQYRDIEYIR